MHVYCFITLAAYAAAVLFCLSSDDKHQNGPVDPLSFRPDLAYVSYNHFIK